MKCGQMHASILEDFPARTLVPVKPQEWDGKDLAEEGRYAAWTPGSICSVTHWRPNTSTSNRLRLTRLPARLA